MRYRDLRWLENPVADLGRDVSDGLASSLGKDETLLVQVDDVDVAIRSV
jgi:hypothetical protein